jgi:hypothetical protein
MFQLVNDAFFYVVTGEKKTFTDIIDIDWKENHRTQKKKKGTDI